MVKQSREDDLFDADEQSGDPDPEVLMDHLRVAFEMTPRVQETEYQL